MRPEYLINLKFTSSQNLNIVYIISMPEGNRKTPVDIELNYSEFSESFVNGYNIYTFYITGDHYLELPLDANVRLPSEKSIPYKEMVKTLEKNPSNFFLQNSGINIIASDVRVNRINKTVKLHFEPNTGIVNGGHTQLALIRVKEERDIAQAEVRLEIIKHNFTAQELAVIAASRNTASNVKPYSTAEKKGLFTPIKSTMLPQFEKHIIWYENRPVPNNRGMLALDLIAYLNLFDVTSNQSDYKSESIEQPNKSATSKSAVFKEWEQNPDRLKQTYPLVNDIINLLEHIQTTYYKKIPRGFTTLGVIKNLQGKEKKSLFMGKKIEFDIPKQFLLPVLASMRADLKYDEKNRKIGWFEKPEDIFDRCKYSVITALSKTYKATYHNELNRASKDSNLWQILYLNVEREVDKKKSWKMYDVPQ